MRMVKLSPERVKQLEKMACKHPSTRLYAWTAYDGTLCVCCCACGKVLRGAV